MIEFPCFEDVVSFAVPNAGKPCETWYRVIGSLESGTPVLIVLHGGPGAGHDYLVSLIDLYRNHGLNIVFYDQIGCGRSTHLREKAGDESFWRVDLFIHELDNLIDHLKLRENGFYLFGQSWGGIVGAVYATRRPHGLRKLIISGGPASIPLYVEGVKGLIAALPPDIRDTLEECNRRGDYTSPEFKEAAAFFNSRHVCRIDPLPDEVQDSMKNLEDDPTAYLTIQGPSEFVILGSFKDWEGWQDAHRIEVPTLLLNGRYDEMTDLCVEPWFRAIPQVKWVTLENASHMGHLEERTRYMQLCGSFLAGRAP